MGKKKIEFPDNRKSEFLGHADTREEADQIIEKDIRIRKSLGLGFG